MSNSFSAVKRVDKPLLGTVGNGVHSKIPAGEVLFQVSGKGYRVRMAAVRVTALFAEGSNFKRLSFFYDGYGTVPEPGQDGFIGGKNILDFFGQSVGAQVVVMRKKPLYQVADAPADQVCLISGGIKLG